MFQNYYSESCSSNDDLNSEEDTEATVKPKHPSFSEAKNLSSKTWIPPKNFRKNIRSRKPRELQQAPTAEEEVSRFQVRSQAVGLLSTNNALGIESDTAEKPMATASHGTKTDLNQAWGERVKYGASLLDLENGDLIWDFVEPGMFGTFRLRKSHLSAIEAFAEAEISSNDDQKEEGLLIINDQHHLRKVLSVDESQWHALIESLEENDTWCLHYSALSKPASLHTASAYDKLWHFLCKRRHHLPTLAIRMRRAGIKKQALKILPKFIVHDIRSFSGDNL